MSGRGYKSVICSKNFSSIWSSGLNELSYEKLAESVSQKGLQGLCSFSEKWEHLEIFSAKLPLPQNAPLRLKNAKLTTRQFSIVEVPKNSPK